MLGASKAHHGHNTAVKHSGGLCTVTYTGSGAARASSELVLNGDDDSVERLDRLLATTR